MNGGPEAKFFLPPNPNFFYDHNLGKMIEILKSIGSTSTPNHPQLYNPILNRLLQHPTSIKLID